MDVRENWKNKNKYSFERKFNFEAGEPGTWSKVDVEIPEEPEVEENGNQFRAIMAQVLAVSSINLILLDLGMVLAFPTIVIPVLLQSSESLKFTEDQASWFGSIAFICQPIGSLLSGFLFEPIGRKKTMLYVNIPLLLGWILIYFGDTITYLYVAGFIMGTGIGFMDAPHITYLGEITEPKYRGILTAYAELCIALGYTFVYFLSISIDWKTVSIICSSVPMAAMLLISQVPESPMWLLSKGRIEEAEMSLCWLRGWTKSEVIQKEFLDLIRHNDANSVKKKPKNINEDDTAPLNSEKIPRKTVAKNIVNFIGLGDVLRKPVLQPLALIVIYFAFSHTAGVSSTRPFMVDILKEFGTPLDANLVTAISSVVGIAGFVTGMVLLPKTGKRKLSIFSMVGCAVTNLLTFVYGYTHLNITTIPVSLFILLNFIWSVGIGQIPWMLISEVFPFKGRGIASGISAAVSYILAFIFTKTYYDMHNDFTLFGVFGFYGVCMVVGGIFLYYFLPETEGKTLEQIEAILEGHFSKIHHRWNTNSGTKKNEISS